VELVVILERKAVSIVSVFGRLLSFLEMNLADPKELAEIVRRIHVPHYEEAGKFLEKALGEGFIAGRDYSRHHFPSAALPRRFAERQLQFHHQ
jgi:hypothetical protein